MYVLYISWQEFDSYAQDEHRPEDVQSQQHEQQPVEEAEAEEGADDGQRVHERRMYDPGPYRNREPTQNHLRSGKQHAQTGQFVTHKRKSLEHLEYLWKIKTCRCRTLVDLMFFFLKIKIQLCCIDELNSRKASLSFWIN